MVPFSVILSDPSATFQSFNDKHSRAASLRQLSFLFLMPRSALRCSMYIILARYCPPRWYVRVRTPPRGSDRVESICYSKFSKKIARLVGRLVSGPRLLGQIGPGVQVTASFQKKIVRLVSRLGRKMIDCLCVAKTRTFLRW